MVIKWPTLMCRYADIVQTALPATPSLFLYRNPLEILSSIEARPLGKVEDMQPHLLAGPGQQVTDTNVSGLAAIAHLLAANCEWIAQSGSVVSLDYARLSGAGRAAAARYFGFSLTKRQCDQIAAEASINAKLLNQVFVPDSDVKRARASEECRRLAKIVFEPSLARALGNLVAL